MALLITKGLRNLLLWGGKSFVNLKVHAAPQKQTAQALERYGALKMIAQRKKHIKILAERFKHSIKHDKDIIKLNSPLNLIIIHQLSKDKIFLGYNTDEGQIELELNDEDFIDLLITILRRVSYENVAYKNGDSLDLKIYLEEEGTNAIKDIDLLRKDIIKGNSTNRILFGNRIKAEYFNGVIILTDDIMMKGSNIIDLDGI